MRILLVEDDALIGEGIRDGLADAGLTVDWLRDGESARAALQTSDLFDLLLLDLNLPRLDGLSLLTWIRAQGQTLPVLILSARDQVDDRINGLDIGADDYLVKPFSLGELTARVRAHLRRQHRQPGPRLTWRDVLLDPSTQTVTRAGEPITLTASEYRILYVLMSSYPHLISRRQLEDKLYGWEDSSESNVIGVHLTNLRKKIGQDAICNVRGMGWRLAGEFPC